MKPSGPRSNDWASAGNGPSSGSPARIQNTSEKKAPCPADCAHPPSFRLDPWVSRRNLVEPLYPAAFARLVAQWAAVAVGGTNAPSEGCGRQSLGLLWGFVVTLAPAHW